MRTMFRLLSGPNNKKFQFTMKDSVSSCMIEIVNDSHSINHDTSRAALVEAFVGEYQKYLSPGDICENLKTWRDGDDSVQKYYENYFDSEFRQFESGHLAYWIQATVNGKVVGWATFEFEKSDSNAVYMNLLAVHPDYQHNGIGEQLVMALINLQEIPDLSAIHLLLRKANQGGRVFYSNNQANNPRFFC